jgi:hypothetical protein
MHQRRDKHRPLHPIACRSRARRPACGRLLTSLALAALLIGGLATTNVASARTLEVGPDKLYKVPSRAAADAKDGDHVVIAPGEYFDCAVWRANDLVIEGTGPDASAVLTDKTCMDKAIFVVTGNNTTIRNLTLTRARVPDMNGAGIRLEGRNLTVDAVKFIDNQEGILGGGPDSRVLVRDSLFLKNGSCVKNCAHGIYVGEVELLRVERSRFFETQHAHHIKSRALRTEVIGCDITDGSSGTSSYLIETPNGGSLVVRNNTLEKGPRSENHQAAISIGSEGVTHRTLEIIVDNNKFANDGDFQTVFVRNLTATAAMLRGNKLSGKTTALLGDGSVE